MADKLNDQEIANEFKRFSETIKLPITKQKRPILIKKLNHYYSKENPPVKKGKGSNRQQKPVVKSTTVEFSDDSQDEPETNVSKISVGRNSNATNSYSKRTPRKQRTRDDDNGASTSGGGLRSRSSSLGRKKRVSAKYQMEIYPDEYTDNDTADDSVYEVEEQSIGINTTLNYDDGDDTLDEDDFKPSYLTRSSTKRRHINANMSTLSQADTSNHIGNNSEKNSPDEDSLNLSESGHFISKTILTIVGVFFVILALSYIYVRRDLFLPKEAASSKPDLKAFSFKEGGEMHNFSAMEIDDRALPILNNIHKYLARLKGQYELGEIPEKKMRISIERVKELYVYSSTLQGDEEHLWKLCLLLILRYPDWDILAFADDGSEAQEVKEVAELEGAYGDLPAARRVVIALYKVLYGLCLLAICVCVGVLGICYLRWQNKRKEKAQQKVYDMVEKIIEMLRENFELAERKNDSKNYPPYMAVQHIRDQLISVSRRRQMQSLWDDAVEFIEGNESRIRVETQVIQGEEFTVWRWLQAMPNGHKMWQGQAFGETSQASVNSLPYGPTPCLKVRNMFDTNSEQNVDDWHLDIEESVLEKCRDNHGILHVFVHRTSGEGCVYIKCNSCEKAYEAYQALHGWWFDGRLVTVKYLRLEHYHDRFPDSRNKKYPMKPSKTEMPSVSRPYYRSALEMT